MVRAGAGFSGAAAAPAAGEEAAELALGALGGASADALVVVATRGHAPSLDAALRRIERLAGGAPLAGLVADRVLALGHETETDPGLGVLALSGVSGAAFWAPDVAHAFERGEAAQALGRPPDGDDVLCLFFDAVANDLRGLPAAAAKTAGAAGVFGAGASDAGAGASCTFAGTEPARGGVAGLWLRAHGAARASVTFSCRLLAGPFRVTRSEGHWVERLDGRPALDVYREAAREPLARDLPRAQRFVLVSLDPEGGGSGGVIRHVAGVSEERRAFALPEPVGRGRTLGFAFRDADVAREELRATLAEAAVTAPAAALYLGCCERGGALFGVAGLEAAYLARHLPGVPALGLATVCQLGPLPGSRAPALLTHAAVLATFPR